MRGAVQRPLFPMPEADNAQTQRGQWVDKGATGRAMVRIALGLHPLECVEPGLRLHPDACRDVDERKAGPRCGGCRFVVRAEWHSRSYNKCARTRDGQVAELLDQAPRAAHSEATDLRLWWPACTTYEPNPTEGDVSDE